MLEIVHGFDLILRELSGMARVRLPARRRRRRRLHARLRHPRLPRRHAASSSSATRSSPRSRRTPATRRRPPRRASRSSRSRSRRTATRPSTRWRPRVSDRTAALMVNNPDDMGVYNPHIKRVGRARPRGGRPVLLRPRELQRRDGQHPRPRARLRRLHVHAPQDVRRAQGRRRAGGRRVRLHRGARAVPARARSSSKTATATRSRRTPRARSAGCASTGATSRSS